MRTFHFPRIIVLAALVILLPLFVQAQATSAATEAERRTAESAWEALIRAKGGHARLNSVTSIVWDKPWETRLFVPPDFEWEFSKRDVFGHPDAWVTLNDFTIQIQTNFDSSGKEKDRVAMGHNWEAEYQDDYVMYMLEMKGDKPEPVRLTSEIHGKTRIEVLRTNVRSYRIDFVYEPEELLVREARLYFKGDDLGMTYSFADYVDVDGIKMPTREGFKLGGKYPDKKFIFNPISFQLNVEYDPDLLTRRPPDVSANGWKRKN